MNVLVVNAGSASMKLRLIRLADAGVGAAGAGAAGSDDNGPGWAGSGCIGTGWAGSDGELVGARDLSARAGRPDPGELRAAIAELIAHVDLSVVGHRVVHGGRRFIDPVLVDADVEAELWSLVALAPLHQPPALAALGEVRAAVPDVPQVACFDTAFHAGMPPAATTYAVPAVWRERYGIRRYGFHGLSHAYASRRAAELTGARRVVTAHLGSGASLAAVRDGAGVDTTMGFTPLEGLVMATRSGTVDPGLLLWLQTEQGMGAADLTDALFHSSGLVALAGTADMREVAAGADTAGSPAASALAVYLHRLRAQIAAMAAALGGLDALVFTGGVGENAASVRAGAAAGLEFLGVLVDAARNDAHRGGDSEIGSPDAAVRTLVVEAREDLEIARGARSTLRRAAGETGDPPAS